MSAVSPRKDSQELLFSLPPSTTPARRWTRVAGVGGGEEGGKGEKGEKEGRGREGSFHLRYRIQVLRNPTPHLFGVAMLYCASPYLSRPPHRLSPLFSIAISYSRLKVEERIEEKRKRINKSKARWFCRSIQRSPHLTLPPPPFSPPLLVRLRSRQLSFSAIFR